MGLRNTKTLSLYQLYHDKIKVCQLCQVCHANFRHLDNLDMSKTNVSKCQSAMVLEKSRETMRLLRFLAEYNLLYISMF